MARVLLIKNDVLLLGQVVYLALLGVIGIQLVSVPLLVQHSELLLELPVVLARGVAGAHLLLRRLAVGTRLLLVHRAGLVSAACAIVVEVLVVRRGLRLPFRAVAQLLL